MTYTTETVDDAEFIIVFIDIDEPDDWMWN
jgi:hypothetical protein